jgi:predicted small lipoprotein YifL
MNKVHARPDGGCRLAMALLLLLGGALALAGCGVRGSLEAPAAEPVDTGNATPGTPGQAAPHKPSILDPILR